MYHFMDGILQLSNKLRLILKSWLQGNFIEQLGPKYNFNDVDNALYRCLCCCSIRVGHRHGAHIRERLLRRR